MKKKQQLFKIVMTSILIALNVVLETYLPIPLRSTDNDINLGFIAVAFAACYLGIPYAIAVGGIGDFIGSFLKGTGSYFFGFTLTNMLVALCFALLLYKNATILKISLAVLINKILFSAIMNTCFLCYLKHTPFLAELTLRLPNVISTFFVEILVISLLFSNKSKFNNLIRKTLPH